MSDKFNTNAELLAACKYQAEELEKVGVTPDIKSCANCCQYDAANRWCQLHDEMITDGVDIDKETWCDDDHDPDEDVTEFYDNLERNGRAEYDAIMYYGSFYDWLNEQLDIEYTITARGEYKHGIVCTGTGGPHIEVDTRTHEVKGYWGGDKASASVSSDAIARLDEALEEMYECVRGVTE